MNYISLFGKKEEKTKVYFTQSDKVIIGSNTILEYAFQVGNFYNILQNSTSEGNIKAYKHNLLLTLNKLQSFEKCNVCDFTELLEYVYIKNYKKTSTRFCELLAKLFPKYYSINLHN